jgi:hypothetical protein
MDWRDILTVLREQGYPEILTDRAATEICQGFGVVRLTANNPDAPELLLHVAQRLAKNL